MKPLRLLTLVAFVALHQSIAFADTTTVDFGPPVTLLDLKSGYGDRVTGPSTAGFQYTGTGAFTPHVIAAFGAREGGLAYDAVPWAFGYNDLQYVIYAPVTGSAGGGGELTVTLTADPGHAATVEAFDLGNWGPAITVPYVRVTDENGAVLFEELNVDLNVSTSPIERNFVFNPAPTGRILVVHISVAGLLSNADNVGLDNLRFGEVPAPAIDLGQRYCSPAVGNTSAGPATLRIWGQPTLAANDVRLVATGLPQGVFGFFVASRSPGQVANPGGSQGVLCLGGAIARYSQPSAIRSSADEGNFALQIDLVQIPMPTGIVSAQVGDTWHFSAWFRDTAQGLPTSNFTDAVVLQVQ